MKKLYTYLYEKFKTKSLYEMINNKLLTGNVVYW